MKHKGDIKKSAKKLFSLSFVNKTLNEQRVLEIVRSLISDQGTQTRAILGMYKNIVTQYIKSHTLVIEVPKGHTITSKEQKELQDISKTDYIEVVENDKIIVGARITHGDWVYDQTLDARLTQLKNSL